MTYQKLARIIRRDRRRANMKAKRLRAWLDGRKWERFDQSRQRR